MVTPSTGSGAGAGARIGSTSHASWQERVDQALSAGLASELSRHADQAARRALEASAFDALRARFVTEVKPALERCAGSMQAWGLTASVSQALRDRPARMRRGFDLVLRMEKFDGRGPGTLTLTATEGRDALRVVLRIGPSCIGGGYSEHDGLVNIDDLSEDMIGGLVATMVERLFP